MMVGDAVLVRRTHSPLMLEAFEEGKERNSVDVGKEESCMIAQFL